MCKMKIKQLTHYNVYVSYISIDMIKIWIKVQDKHKTTTLPNAKLQIIYLWEKCSYAEQHRWYVVNPWPLTLQGQQKFENYVLD